MKSKQSSYLNWKKTLVKSNSSLEVAIRKLEQTALQVVLVIGKNKRLVGTITDGDIRRGLLKGLTTKDKINSVISKNPVTVNSLASENKIKKIMSKFNIRQIPIVNKKKQVVNLFVLDKLNFSKKISNKIIFMVGGKGKRLMPLTKLTPKPMLRIKGIPILERLVKKAKIEGFYNFVFITNHLEKVIKNYFKSGSRWGVKIKYFNENTPLGTAGGLRHIKDNKNNPVIVSNGDVISEVNFRNLIDFHQKQNNEVTIAVKKLEVENPYGVVKMSQEKVVDLIEKPVSRSYVSAGIYVFNSYLFKKIKKNKYTDMTSFINKLLKDKVKINACPLHESWTDIGKHTDYKKVNN